MMKTHLITLFALATSVVLITPACSKSDSSKDAPAAVSEKAPTPVAPSAASVSIPAPTAGKVPASEFEQGPAWMLKDLEGKEVKSADFAGKVVIIDFWATWCPPCRAEIPGYVALQKKYKERGLVIVGISLDRAGVDVVKAFREKMGINYPLVMGDETVVDAFGGVEGIPTTFVIDREGNQRYKKVGYMEEDKMEAWINSLL